MSALTATITATRRRLGRIGAVARDGLDYPALRHRASTAQAPVDALASLGFDRAALESFEAEFERVATPLYAELAARAAAAGAAEAAARLERRSAASHRGKALLYLAVRATRPALVAETGTYNGAGSAFLLSALEANGAGRLVSFDVVDAYDALGVPLAAGQRPGWLVPERLRDRFTLVLGDTRETLRATLDRAGGLGLFAHDSLHTARHMRFELRTAWRALEPGGVLAVDDAFWNSAFWLFTKLHRVPFRHIGTVGVTRKP